MPDRLSEALERVEQDPGRPVDVAAMARTALVSEHHLRRMFSALAGMAFSEYVRRRRLTLAEIDCYRAAATSTTEVPEGMESLEVPAGTWVVFPFKRYTFPEAIQRIWVYAFSEWFPSHPAHQHVHGPEMLRVEYDAQESDLASGELWMPVGRV